ncbi:hypothetical protein M0638_25130 [Roseomonas sp. NAR14]|uniref:DUF7352 domain-containing protein n=1 Tax=Roseomonas acroporae TaxID=2937791 RepID=A0A9X1YEL0_9PROT|nr:hypothetical protein [Roseomonas acroporae]MCK8787655.1 hypothetical protein [Roseomonas acroporae]
MSRAVWKFVLTPKCTISMPEGAELLHVAAQGGEVCLWALVNPERPVETRRFRAFGTGHAIPAGLSLRFVGTALLAGGALVFHVFEERGQ